MENCDPNILTESIQHVTNSVDAGFSGTRVRYEPRTVSVRIVRNDGKHIFSTGDATYGALGHGSFDSSFAFTEIPVSNFDVRSTADEPSARRSVLLTKVASGHQHTLVLDANDRLFVFGNSNQGQLGIAGLKCSTKPRVWDGRDVDGGMHMHIMDSACGGDHSMVVTDDDDVLTWGSNEHGQLGSALDESGSGMFLDTPRVLRLPSRSKIVQVACGLKHCALLLDEGTVLTWGYGKSGALGHGTTDAPRREDEASPRPVQSLSKTHIFHIACGEMHTAVISSAGDLYTAGWGENGRLGRLEAKDALSSTFERVELKQRKCTYVACGGAHTMLLTDTRDVLAFGANHYGQLGLGDCRDRHRPSPVVFFRAVLVYDIKLGQTHSLAISDKHLLYAWGNGEQGQCGVGSYPQLYTLPHLVRSLVGCNVVQVSAGAAFTVVLTSVTPADVAERHQTDRALAQEADDIVTDDVLHREAVRDELRLQHQRRVAQRHAAATTPLATLWQQLDAASKAHLEPVKPAIGASASSASAVLQSKSLRRALQSAVATQRPRSSLGCCVGRPRSSAAVATRSPSKRPPSPRPKTAWFLAQLARRPQTPPPSYADAVQRDSQ
ncbi:hypothetical protein SPRG_03930 [Saprolegnia parasitica CBS 223.65]|uniref:RCC1-like domain-containing protein n=1 Tax=Saprolegnia parasitica (strain CBS 223.65) TaxID=695850 RepID=A0A067CKS7_SAPPC|nr:hypothetical protein SPRG_03930 [Saprolegnia parasitica CBS 223.65]KDO31314.1 hypothetical protein SPRG_03930 [Saprolegnia parasitica CBS 223.65]|eukprot:XP_012197913.1 hypothetical protein SPRG_03930 [Saprolegnia parasitica CBS 223.65]